MRNRFNVMCVVATWIPERGCSAMNAGKSSESGRLEAGGCRNHQGKRRWTNRDEFAGGRMMNLYEIDDKINRLLKPL